jgi:hypothetical protein
MDCSDVSVPSADKLFIRSYLDEFPDPLSIRADNNDVMEHVGRYMAIAEIVKAGKRDLPWRYRYENTQSATRLANGTTISPELLDRQGPERRSPDRSVSTPGAPSYRV